VAQFYAHLKEEFGDHPEEAEAKAKPIAISEITVPQDYTGLMLDDPLAPGSGADLLQSFLQGLPLAEKFAASILKQCAVQLCITLIDPLRAVVILS